MRIPAPGAPAQVGDAGRHVASIRRRRLSWSQSASSESVVIDKERAEAAALVVKLLDLGGDLDGFADDPDVLHQVVDRHRLVGHRSVQLGGGSSGWCRRDWDAGAPRSSVRGRRAPLAATGRGRRDEHVARDAPLTPVRLRPPSTRHRSRPGASGRRRYVPGQERARHRDPAAFPGHAHGAGVGRAGRHRDGRMGPLVGLHVVAAVLHGVEHGVSMSKNFAVVVNGPSDAQGEHDLQHFRRAGAHVGRILRVEAESDRSVGMAPPPMPHWKRPRAMWSSMARR